MDLVNVKICLKIGNKKFVSWLLNIITIKKDLMHNAGLLIINKPKIHWDSYYEMSVLLQYDKICTLPTINNILQYKHII